MEVWFKVSATRRLLLTPDMKEMLNIKEKNEYVQNESYGEHEIVNKLKRCHITIGTSISILLENLP